MITRNDWSIPLDRSKYKVELSNNVCLDYVLLEKIKTESCNINFPDVFNYPKEDVTYSIISKYYQIDPRTFSIGMGATELIQRICHIFHGQRIKILSPTFEMVRVYSDMYKMEISEVHYYDFNKVSMDKLIDSDIIYIANPNGNNGHSFSKSQIEYIIKNNKFVILDESYIEYSSNPSLFELVNKYDNICVLRTFSKSLGCAGIRCGLCYSNEEFIRKMQQIRMNYVSCGITNYILSNYIHEINDTVDRMKQAKLWLSSRFNILNENGNFICIRQDIEKFNWCKVKKVDDYIRITLTNFDIFEKNII